MYRGRQRCPACFCAGIEGYAGANLTTGNDNINIAAVDVAGESGTIRIGVPAKQTATYIAGINGQTVANGTSVFVNASVSLALSSRRYKEDIKRMENESEAVLALNPVTFQEATRP